MDYAIVFLLKIGTAVAELSLVCLGLAVIFGMMRIINLAHGEFIMIGAYAAISAEHWGVNIWVAMLVAAPLVTGAVGMMIERSVIRYLHGRMIDTMLATWGLGLVLVGLVNIAFGSATAGVSSPLGGLEIGAYTTSAYEVALIPITFLAIIGVWLMLRFTRVGLVARGTMQNPEMAASLGVSTGTIYAASFGIGSALSGLAGGLLAPLTGVVPTMGAAYIAHAFITVISGGAAALTGTVVAASLFGTISTATTFASNSAMGDVALLAVALGVLRFLPRGITGRFMRGSL
jgi:branched-subunit amino acid ABC-type transport system permease component